MNAISFGGEAKIPMNPFPASSSSATAAAMAGKRMKINSWSTGRSSQEWEFKVFKTLSSGTVDTRSDYNSTVVVLVQV